MHFHKKKIKYLKVTLNPVLISFYGSIVFITLSTLVVLSALWKMLASGSSQSAISSILETAFDSEFLRSISRTLQFAFLAIMIKIIVALPLAFLVRRLSHKIISAMTLLPWVLPPAISALAWMWFFYDIDGGANILLRAIGLPEVSWLGDSNWSFIICLFFNIWREVPLWAWIISPTLSGLGSSLSMLAKQESLTKWERFRLLIFPRLRPTLIALSILSLIWSFGEFEAIWILTKGGPGESTELLSIYAYRHTFLAQNIGRGAAAFLCFLPISVTLITILVLLYQWSSRRVSR